MNTTRSCGCKGYNSCLVCEAQHGIVNEEAGRHMMERFDKKAVYCIDCDRIFSGKWHDVSCFGRGDHDGATGCEFEGVLVLRDFVTEAEESQLMAGLDDMDWDASQSGRRKQNFGPRANFKKRKAKVGQHFHGFPKCTEFVQQRFRTVPVLEGYQTVEQCSIEYRPETGARIDPHIDDCWIWGERIVQLHMLSDSVLTLFPYTGSNTKYNLADVEGYPRVVGNERQVAFNPFASKTDSKPYEFKPRVEDAVVRIPLPRRSLLVMYGEARYQWEHCILRSDVSARRAIIAYRELTPPYLPGGSENPTGAEIINEAKKFF